MSVNTPHPIGVLIDAVKAVEGWSDQKIVDRARARGYRLSKSNLSRMRSEPVQSVKPDNIRMLSEALGLSTDRVIRAYVGAMGLLCPCVTEARPPLRTRSVATSV